MTDKNMEINATTVAESLRSFDTFVVGAFKRLDGDAVGSELAVYHMLKQLGKDVVVANLEVIPAHYKFIPGAVEAATNYENVAADRQCFVTVDAPDVTREQLFDNHFPDTMHVINIDHHGSNYMYGNENWIDATAAAVGEMLMELLDALKVDLTPEIATAIYVSIVTDTGRFGFDCTKARTHHIAARLHEAGIDLQTITREVYQSKALAEFKLLGCAVSSLRLLADDRLGVVTLTEEDLKSCGTRPEESQSFAELGLNIKGAVMSVFARPGKNGLTKISFRSKSDAVNVNDFAGRYGGGGHAKAAGLTLEMSLQEACETILPAAEDYVRQSLSK